MESNSFPKRRWFRFHLATAIVMMLLMGGLIWANVTPRFLVMRVNGSGVGEGAIGYGWPRLTHVAFLDRPIRPEELAAVELLNTPYPVVWLSIVINVSTALCVCCTAAVICEWLMRGRSAG